MSALSAAIDIFERLPLPDAMTRAAIQYLVGRTRSRLSADNGETNSAFARTMPDFPVAEHTDEANRQHYEVPASFFELVLGPHRKYSCCLYQTDHDDLSRAEENALRETVFHADLQDGQRILELGCGWGSLSLYMAQRFPNARVAAVSNSHSQRQFIEARTREREISNLQIITSDMNGFSATGKFDRIVSVEMFEHMSNWRELLTRAASWLTPDGRLFIHVFTHRSSPYRFDHRDKTDWIAQHFFTGGIMPSRNLIREFSDIVSVERQWEWNGTHYAKTARDWLSNFDANYADIRPILHATYGHDAELWARRWRLFFLATEGLFGHAGGNEWGVSHYLMKQSRNNP